ncbi:MAG: thioredoxin domain-containing protein [Gemmatimonadetes bacterium]|nr:thioredoxin domain-containing protein [Gemmatimonadota bacterium]
MANRLGRESSPYLLQHAHNPVDWQAWGEDAFRLARETDRPLLISIGYSACHWCHVMERESFEDPATAELLNAAFVPVKVDREERPDVDQIYMRAVQAMTGHGGWPLNVFVTPAGVPFYGGTYFPPERRHGMPSFREVLHAVHTAWGRDREAIERSAADIRGSLERAATARPAWTDDLDGGAEGAPPLAEVADHAARALAARFDPTHGGFGGAPKFPQPMLISFLLRHHRRTGDAQSRSMALHTLRRMAAGGMRDHLGGGFHRYSVDARWLVPHFEKMLYDNALLARTYLEAWQATGAADLRAVCESTLDYVLGDLRHAGGGFLAARDADSEGEEGLFYIWTPDDVDAVLGREEGTLFRRVYDVTAVGNFEGMNIPHLLHDVAAIARAEGISTEALEARLAAARARLLAVRAGRPEPFRDTKVITGWSALMARALAEAGGALGRADYVDAARAALRFTLASVRDESGRLQHVWTEGRAHIPAQLEDVAALGNALLSLHEATLEAEWVVEVARLCDDLLARFWDEAEGVFYDTAADAEALVIRPRDPSDNAVPSGNSLAVELLLRAARLLERAEWRRAAERVLEREAPGVAQWPSAFGHLLAQIEEELAEPVEVAVLGDPGDAATRALLGAALRPFVPGRVVTGGPADGGAGSSITVPLLEGKTMLGGRPTAYVCRSRACGPPVTEPEELTSHFA